MTVRLYIYKDISHNSLWNGDTALGGLINIAVEKEGRAGAGCAVRVYIQSQGVIISVPCIMQILGRIPADRGGEKNPAGQVIGVVDQNIRSHSGFSGWSGCAGDYN